MVECSIHIIGNNNIVDSPPLLSNIAYNTVDPPPQYRRSRYTGEKTAILERESYIIITKKKKIRVLKISGGIGGGSQPRGGIEGTTVDCIYHQHLEYIH